MSNDPVEAGLRARLQLFVDDPMWADHAEVPKHLLRTTIATLAAKDAEIAGLRDKTRCCDEAIAWLANDDPDLAEAFVQRMVRAREKGLDHE